MHVELVVPGLFDAPADERWPALELLLARGRGSTRQAASLEEWLAGAFGLGDAPLPAGALTALACGLDALAGGLEPGMARWMRADPVHLRPDRDEVLLFPGDAVGLAAAEAEALAAALNAHFSGKFTLHAVRPLAWCLQGGPDLPVSARPPAALAGRSIDAELPDKRWHALLNEVQMAMYQHAVNTERDARGEPVVNGLWLWGAGRLPDAAALSGRCPWHSVSAEDPVALGLARLAGARHRAPGARAEDWLARAPEDGRHLLILDPPAGLEERWFAPLLAALRSGRIGMITIHVPGTGATFETVRGDLRRFWRRPRPLAEYTAAPA
jgi:hypothetical protein